MTIATANIFTTPCEPMPDMLAPTGDAAERFEARIAMVGAALGMRQLGCNLFTVPAGKRAFPFHNHHAVEELFIIIEGQGEFRLGETVRQVGPGDMIACPAGGADTAHQIRNNGTGELRYLALSSRSAVDIMEYPDSGKFRAMAAGGPGFFDAICPSEMAIGYWEGE